MPKARTDRRLYPFEEDCAHFFAEIVYVFGIPKSVGQIYGLLYASPEPLGFVDIVERLGISKGSASQGLQVLRLLGAINAADHSLVGSDRAGSTKRGVVYEPELSLRKLVTGVLRERIAPLAASGADRLKRLRHLATEAPEHARFYSDRARRLETWRRSFNTVLPVLSALLGPKQKNR